MPQTNLPFSQKSQHKLSTQGLSRDLLIQELGKEYELELELLRARGLDVVRHNALYYYTTRFLPLSEATFCIVDIETNGSKIEKHQIIEIAALKIKNFEIVDRFDTLVKCKNINPHITEITGIASADTKDAPKLDEVLRSFKIFLGESVFVAHDVKFDYGFISASLEKIGLMGLSNRSLCSIDLAERTLVSYRYGLKYLNDYFHLHPEAIHHRAMSDVITTYRLFVKSIQNLPEEIQTVEELIAFSKYAKRLKRPKFDPLAQNDEEE